MYLRLHQTFRFGITGRNVRQFRFKGIRKGINIDNIKYFFPAALSCLGSPPPKGSFFLLSKRNKKHRLKIFLWTLVGWLDGWNPKNLLGRI
ncbi:hypothetical protein DRW42_01385 [Pedobacter miscanthi]|uniref:Uncharacterized protein n=1 Tax=Pedobacter miscanthi TaxID=2259170 RepID=A0A366LDK2_9SPHI|nr:hypothetical protein DRW42_01385 [Pedobacter miscanthi]